MNNCSTLVTGDIVDIRQCFGYPTVAGKVIRTTKTQLIIECKPSLGTFGERRFSRKDGCEVPYNRAGLHVGYKREI